MSPFDTAVFVAKVAGWIVLLLGGAAAAVAVLAALSNGSTSRTSRTTRPPTPPTTALPVPSDPLLRDPSLSDDIRARVLRAYELNLPGLICPLAKQIYRWPMLIPDRRLDGDGKYLSGRTELLQVYGNIGTQLAPIRKIAVRLGASNFGFSFVQDESRHDMTRRTVEVVCNDKKVFALEMFCSWEGEDDRWRPWSVVAFTEGSWIADAQLFLEKHLQHQKLVEDERAARLAPKVDRRDFGLD